jgi:hypothetical protein
MKAHTREELARAVAKYEREVWQRGSDVVAQNRENTLALHDWAQVTRSMLVVSGLSKDPSNCEDGEH